MASPQAEAEGVPPVLVVAGAAGVSTLAATLAFRSALLAIRTRTLGSVAMLYGGLIDTEFIGASVARFATLAAALVSGAQRQGVQLADAFVAQVLEIPPAGIDPTPYLGATAGPLPAILSTVGAPIRLAQSQKRSDAEALGAGLASAERITSTEVMRAPTDAVADLAEKSKRTRGWVRATSPDPCPECTALRDGSVRPWSERPSAHPHCSCVAVPVVTE